MTGRFAGLACAAMLLAACGSGATQHRTSTAAPPRTTVTAVPPLAPATDDATPGASDTVSSAPFAAVAFVDAKVGWAERASGEMYRTADGGQHWDLQYRPDVFVDSGPPAAISVVNREVAFALVPDGLLVTSDAGAHWSVRPSGVRMRAIDFVSPPRGFALEITGDHQQTSLAETDNAGESWRVIAPARSMCFGTRDAGWLVDGDTVKRTTDGGATWTAGVQSPLTDETRGWRSAVYCSGTAVAWLLRVGGVAEFNNAYVLYVTTDAGQHWTAALQGDYGPEFHTTQGDASPGPVVVIDANTAVAEGYCGACGSGTNSARITHDGGRTWHLLDIAGADHVFSWMSFVDPVHGWVAADNGIFATTDGGQTWVRQLPR